VGVRFTSQKNQGESLPRYRIKETLEAHLVNGVKFPMPSTLLLRLCGAERDGKPELRGFNFTQFTRANYR
jgi:hypothetical protein